MCDIYVKDFNENKLNFSDPENVEIKINNTDTSQFLRSGVGYDEFTTRPVATNGMNFKQENDFAYVIMNEMDCVGVFPKSDGKGYQVLVKLTSDDTVNNPTVEEQQNIDFFENSRKAVAAYMSKNIDLIPSQFEFVPEDKMINFVNTLFDHPPKKDENGEKIPKKDANGKIMKNKNQNIIYERDPTKPLMAFISIRCRTGKAAPFNSRFYGPGDKQVDATKYQKVPGRIQPTIRVNFVFYGKAVTFNIEVEEANYIPRAQGGAVGRRRLPPNTAPIEDDIPDPTAQSESDPALDTNPPDETYNPEDEPETEYVEVKTKGGKVIRMPKDVYEKKKEAQRKRGS